MPSLARTIAFRLFGTKQLAMASALQLAGFLLAVFTLPYAVFWAGMFLYVTLIYSLLIGGYGLFTVIVPLLVLLADGVALYLLYQLARGYVKLIGYLLKWLFQQYALAKEDVRLQHLFAESTLA